MRLKALGVKERGAITLDVVDTVLSTRAYRAEEKAAGDPADAVVWDELAGRTREESTLNVTFLTFLCLACLIAAVGVVTDSPVTVVGAMVVGPEFGPLAALAVALVRRKTYLARRAALALLVGFPVAMLRHRARRARGRGGRLDRPGQHPRVERSRLHLPGRPALVRRRAVRRCGRDAVAGVGQVGRPRRRLHLGDDRARRRVSPSSPRRWAIGTSPPSRPPNSRSTCSESCSPGCWCCWVRGLADRRHWHMAG